MNEDYKKYYEQAVYLLNNDITLLNKYYLDTCISHAFNIDNIVSQLCLVINNNGIGIRATGNYNHGHIKVTEVSDEKLVMRVRMITYPELDSIEVCGINIFVMDKDVTEIYGKWYPYVINTFMPKFHQSVINVKNWIEDTKLKYKTAKDEEDREFMDKCDILFKGE